MREVPGSNPGVSLAKFLFKTQNVYKLVIFWLKMIIFSQISSLYAKSKSRPKTLCFCLKIGKCPLTPLIQLNVKQDTFKNWPLIKNPQFLSNHHETRGKWLPHEVIIFTKFHKDRTKIMDFFIILSFDFFFSL